MKIQYLTITLSIIILAMLVLGATQAGCNNAPKGPSFNTSALMLSFVDQAPPNQVNIGTPFQIYVKVDNTGSYPVTAGTAKFYLSGYGNNLRNLNPVVSNQETLIEKTPTQDGGSETIKFAESAEPSMIINNPFNFTFKADACYTYATSTQATVCIGSADGSCTITGEKITTGANTNAPIQVTSVTEQVQGNRLFVSFLIENKGTGQVYYSNFDCDKFFGQDSSDIIRESQKKNQVEVYIDPGQEDLKCVLQNPNGGEAENSGLATVARRVTCSKIVGTSTYPTVIKINLLYRYVNTVTKSMTLLP